MYRERAKDWLKHLDFLLLDLLCLAAAFWLSYALRHGNTVTSSYLSGIYRNMLLALLLIDSLYILIINPFSSILRRGYFQELLASVKHSGAVIILSVLYLFSIQEGEGYSRIVMTLTFGIYAVLTYLVRIGWKQVIRKQPKLLYQRGALLIATTGAMAAALLTRPQRDSFQDYLIKGLILMDDEEAPEQSRMGQDIEGIPVVANQQNFTDYVRREWVDEVFFVLPEGQLQELRRQTDALVKAGVVVHTSLGQIKRKTYRQTIENLCGYTVMTTSINRITQQQAFLKRLMDLAGGLIGSGVALIALLVIGPILYYKSPGPVIFRQQRVGRNGKKFTLYKIRSMYPDAEERKKELLAQNQVEGGMMFKLDFDPRIIGCKRLPDGRVKKGIGNFIRAFSLDELPQFFNVLKGDMSLVGTRPPTVDEWEKYELHHRARLAFKPGITGLWQVSGRSNITDFEKVVELDMRYISEWSFGLDMKILVKTVKAVLKHDGAR